MESKRQRKFSRMLQKDLGEIFQQLSTKYFGGAFITVTFIKISPDLRIAKVYLSFLLVKDKEELMQDIQLQAKQIRQVLASRIRHQVKVIPELHFFLDDTEDVQQEVDGLFNGLDIPPETNEGNDEGEYQDEA